MKKMPEADKPRVRDMTTREVLDFQLRLQLRCNMSELREELSKWLKQFTDYVAIWMAHSTYSAALFYKIFGGTHLGLPIITGPLLELDSFANAIFGRRASYINRKVFAERGFQCSEADLYNPEEYEHRQTALQSAILAKNFHRKMCSPLFPTNISIVGNEM